MPTSPYAHPMKMLPALAIAAFTAFLALGSQAQDTEQIKSALRKKFPDAPIDSVRKIPYGPLYEVIGSGEILYTDAATTFLFAGGALIDTKTRENITEVRMRSLNAVKWETLPLESAIKIVRGNGTRKFAIFEDPNCGYCKKFERDIAHLDDVTMYVFLTPILSPDSAAKSKAVWCSADRGKAWLDLMIRDVSPPGDGKCDTPIDKILAFSNAKKIQGTPTIFFEDGERVPGAMPAAQFDQKLTAVKGMSAAKAAAK
jgi:thiol:disulfide interchange protein DsbC